MEYILYNDLKFVPILNIFEINLICIPKKRNTHKNIIKIYSKSKMRKKSKSATQICN